MKSKKEKQPVGNSAMAHTFRYDEKIQRQARKMVMEAERRKNKDVPDHPGSHPATTGSPGMLELEKRDYGFDFESKRGLHPDQYYPGG